MIRSDASAGQWNQWMLYAFFCVISRRLNFICRRFGALFPFHLHGQVGVKMEKSVPKRRHIKFRRREITQKTTYNIQNKAKVRNNENQWMFECHLCGPSLQLTWGFNRPQIQTNWLAAEKNREFYFAYYGYKNSCWYFKWLSKKSVLFSRKLYFISLFLDRIIFNFCVTRAP